MVNTTCCYSYVKYYDKKIAEIASRLQSDIVKIAHFNFRLAVIDTFGNLVESVNTVYEDKKIFKNDYKDYKKLKPLPSDGINAIDVHYGNWVILKKDGTVKRRIDKNTYFPKDSEALKTQDLGRWGNKNKHLQLNCQRINLT